MFSSCVNDYMEDIATFTALAKIYSTEYFCSTKVAGLGKLFVQQKFLAIQYMIVMYTSVPHTYVTVLNSYMYKVIYVAIHVYN